jgi:hypothetical protein
MGFAVTDAKEIYSAGMNALIGSSHHAGVAVPLFL